VKPSGMRRKQAVDAARLYAYGKIKEMPQDFDERQQRIFHKYVGIASAQKVYYDVLDNDMWQAYTGMTREEYDNSQKALSQLVELSQEMKLYD